MVPVFIESNSDLPIIPVVSGVSGTCRVMTSDLVNISATDSALSEIGISANGSKAITLRSKADAIFATWAPMRP